MEIPTNWTFKDKKVAEGFDAHVREQLPWYSLVTEAVVHLARHYVPVGGKVYDIGASTGNITNAICNAVGAREPVVYAIDESLDMRNVFYQNWGEQRSDDVTYVVADALKYDFKQFDFGVCFLTMMFFPVAERRAWLSKMRSLIRPGGALVVVDKVATPSGYVGTVLRRLVMDWKIRQGAKSDDVVKKELSLAGYQRPIDERMFDDVGQKFFQMGEFAGWVVERGEA